jgi:RecB family exonuclease
MTLRLIVGQATVGKTGRVYEIVRRAVHAGEAAIVVLPTIPDVARARRELARELPLGVKTLTFHGLVSVLWDQWGDGRLLVSDDQRELVFAAIARKRGQSRAMGRFAADCSVRLAEKTGEQWRFERPVVTGPGSALAPLLADYADHLGSSASIEPAEAAWHLGRQNRAFSSVIAVHRFGDLTPSQVSLLRGAAAQGEVIVTLTWERGFKPTAALDSLVDTLASFGSVEIVRAPTDYPPLTHPTLQELGESLFSSPRSLPEDGAVRLVLAEGGEAEAAVIAEEIQRALSDGVATAPDRIAVAFRDPASHRTELRQALDDAGIPADYDIPLAFPQVPLGAAFLDVLVFGTTGERAPLLNLIRSPFSGVDTVTARNLEHRWREGGTKDPRVLIAQAGEKHPRLRRMLYDVRQMATDPLSSADCERLALVARVLFASRYGTKRVPAGSDVELDARAHASLMSLLSGVSGLSDMGPRLTDVREALTATLVTVGRYERPGRVQVMPVTRLRGRRFETVIIAGMNASEFPAAAPESAAPGSAVDAVLRQFGGGGEARGGVLFEQLLFYEAITRAKNRLVLSAQTASADGEALSVSPLMEGVADFYRGEGEEQPIAAHVHRRLGGQGNSHQDASQRARMRAAARLGDEREPRVATARRRTQFRPGMLSTAGRAATLENAEVFTASQIQSYVRCPYRWFHEYRLSPRELERRFDARDEGEFAHQLLATTYRTLIDEGRQHLTPVGLEHAYEVLDRAYDAKHLEQGEPESLEQQVGRAHAVQWARRVLSEDAGRADEYVPAFIEWEFGGGDDPVDMGGYRLRGRIDRIDVDSERRAVVIDYKRTCGSSHAANKIVTEGLVQVPLYLEAVRRKARLQPVAGLYRGLSAAAERGVVMQGAVTSRRFTSTDVRDSSQFEALIREALNLSARAVGGMRAGRIAPDPYTPKACSGCPVAHVCGARR